MMGERGIVKEVFIPTEEYQSVMDSNKIGFKVQVGTDIIEMIEIIKEQDFDNVRILKNDKVILTKNIVDNKAMFDIKKEGVEDGG
ncbi:MAG: hypothetical protein HFJ12_06115 [Bacilli bacterium]|nr:hypothetical protein [Bacilli bacterium]